MNNRDFDDETLMAFADGELDAEASARIEAAIETDDTLAERVAIFMESRARAAAALKSLAEEPVPDALMRSVRQMVDDAREQTALASKRSPAGDDNVISLQSRSRPAPSRWMMPLAASLAIVVAGAGGYFAGRGGAPSSGGVTTAQFDDPAIGRGLDTMRSGEEVRTASGTMRLVSTFRDEAGALCREFELSDTSAIVSVACRADERWNLRLAVAAPISGADYTPAGAAETVDAYLATIQAGAPLSAPEEAEALKGLQP
jgi:hypothetical protein